MPTTKDIQAFVDSLQTSQMRFVADLNAEELEYLCNAANNRYENSFVNVYTDKLRILNEPSKESTKHEDRLVSKLSQFFARFNIFAKMSDKDIGTFTQDNLWINQDLFSNESALLENIIERLLRSEQPALPLIKVEDAV